MNDFNLQHHLNNVMGFGRGGGKAKTDDYVNDENAMGEHAKASVDRAVEGASLTIPVIGKLFSTIFSGNSATAGLESEGIAGKNIMPSVIADAQGGFLARLLSLLGKNRAVTDHTQMPGDSGGGGGGGGFADAGGGGFADYNTMDFGNIASPANSFDWSSVPMAMLGELSPPNVGDRGPAVGAGMDFA